MTAQSCQHWANGGYCGATQTRLYRVGRRCTDHAPASSGGNSQSGEQQDLDIARDLIKAGVPVFVAPPNPSKEIGFDLPTRWEQTKPDLAVVDRWKPGYALCAVGGVAADFVDVDPRNGGDDPAKLMMADGNWPNSYGRAVTPSGGTHDLISPLGIGKTKRDGIDYQGGDLEGRGRGFVFIAPTVRPSKTTGEHLKYRWTKAPNMEALRAAKGIDKSGTYFTEWVTTKPDKPHTNGHKPGTGRTKESEHTGRIPPGQGHDEMTSYCGLLLKKYPDGALEEYIEKCRLHWEDFDQSKFSWTWAECLKNPVMDCWHRFERGEPYVPRDNSEKVQGSQRLDDDVWNSSPSLQHIRQAAISRGRSAEAVLFATMARLSAMVSPLLRFENCLGEGSLNFFVAAIGPSGFGKSKAMDIAQEMLIIPTGLTSGDRFKDGNGIGSGEGIAELYMGTQQIDTGEVYGPKAKKAGQPIYTQERGKFRDNAFLYVDEGQTLTQQGKRLGNIVYPTMRSAWSGQNLGQANAHSETSRQVPRGSYSLGMVIGYQKKTAQDLLMDVLAGTPQRFFWANAVAVDIPANRADRPEWPGPLPLDLTDGLRGVRGGRIKFHNEIEDELWAWNYVKSAEEEPDELDSQKPLMLCKIATLLMLLDDEAGQLVTNRHWALAKTAYDSNRAVIDDLLEYGQMLAQDRADASADAAANKEARGYLAKKNADDNVHRIALWLYVYVKEHGVTTSGEAKRKAASRDRGLFGDALDYAISMKWLSTDGKKITTGMDEPTS
jgi:Bifunctional DNA primase/polymerase, N-terminal